MDKSFLFALLTAFIWGCAPALEKIGLEGRMDPFLGVVIRSIPIAVLSLAALLFTGKAASLLAEADFKSVAFVIAGGLVAGLLGQYAFYSALKAGNASVVVPVAATYPLVALAVSVAFLGEALTVQKVAGIAMVVAGVILLK